MTVALVSSRLQSASRPADIFLSPPSVIISGCRLRPSTYQHTDHTQLNRIRLQIDSLLWSGNLAF